MKTKKEIKNLSIDVRVSYSELCRIDANANAAGMPRATYVREAAMSDTDFDKRAELRAYWCSVVAVCKQEFICAYRAIEDLVRELNKYDEITPDFVTDLEHELLELRKTRENLTKGVKKIWQ